MDKILGGSIPPSRTKTSYKNLIFFIYFACPDFLKFATLSHIRMKGIKVIFAVCLALLGIGNVLANESDDAVRAATRRGATNTVTSTRQKSNTPSASSNTNAVSRVNNATTKQSQPVRERTTVPRAKTNTSNASRTATRDVSPRATTNVTSRAVTTSRTATTPNTTRTATGISRAATRTPTTKTRNSLTRSTLSRTSIARSGTDTTQNLRDTVMNANAKECREVYYNCMDEFCANKDSQLKRCACSSRLHEFDSVKKQLENAEEKMLDFSQRLLTVSMDAEDAAALNIATEGELAFNKKDTSQSQKILDEITKKLNTKFEDDSFDRNLSAISLSLNEDAAFDNVDSLMGASTTLKTGTALYGAALPVCREMAAEVCTPEQLSIAESGYQMMIEQDCNTVKKSYQSQTDTARAKVLENSALLDMSRLSTYQDKNSDDILTCKRKMLDMLSDTSVCGTNLTKCLDMTGQYIDPSTGEAFLTVNLANLSKLITRPSGDQTWTEMPANETFVQHLNSKKKFLEPAMEHCQDIADSVWDGFIEDALAQIKLAQDAKLEQVRQSCTTLTTQCLADTAQSLEDFDARALSTFGVAADKTVNAMCADVKNACTALMEATGDGQTDWAGGMTEIATDTTYDTIIQTCREVGRACIIQACKSISGNFGLCENINTSINRKAIINGTSCWAEVLDCVADAGDEAIERVINQLASRDIIPDLGNSNNVSSTIPTYSFYSELYDVTSGGEFYPALANSIGYDTAQCRTGGTTTITTDVSNTDTSITYTQLTDANGNTLCQDDNGKQGICNTEFKTPLYEKTTEYKRCVYDICVAGGECTDATDTSTRCKTCRIAERIWGNCEMEPSETLHEPYAHNRIIKPNDNESTLLYWFALNTGTESMNDSCRASGCGPGERPGINGTCYANTDFAADGEQCKSDNRIDVPGNQQNCCLDGEKDSFGNCCDSTTGKLVAYTGTTIYSNEDTSITAPEKNSINICIPKNAGNIQYVLAFEATDEEYYINDTNLLVCLGNINTNEKGTIQPTFPSGDTITCDGQYLLITADGVYYSPTNEQTYPKLSYIINDGATTCTFEYDGSNWSWTQTGEGTTSCAANIPDASDHFRITY